MSPVTSTSSGGVHGCVDDACIGRIGAGHDVALVAGCTRPGSDGPPMSSLTVVLSVVFPWISGRMPTPFCASTSRARLLSVPLDDDHGGCLGHFRCR